MVHVVLSIVITWRGVDEPTPETPFFIKQKKKKKTGTTNFNRERERERYIYIYIYINLIKKTITFFFKHKPKK